MGGAVSPRSHGSDFWGGAPATPSAPDCPKALQHPKPRATDHQAFGVHPTMPQSVKVRPLSGRSPSTCGALPQVPQMPHRALPGRRSAVGGRRSARSSAAPARGQRRRAPGVGPTRRQVKIGRVANIFIFSANCTPQPANCKPYTAVCCTANPNPLHCTP